MGLCNGHNSQWVFGVSIMKLVNYDQWMTVLQCAPQRDKPPMMLYSSLKAVPQLTQFYPDTSVMENCFKLSSLGQLLLGVCPRLLEQLIHLVSC